jgi:lysophospholipase L1-like esterase
MGTRVGAAVAVAVSMLAGSLLLGGCDKDISGSSAAGSKNRPSPSPTRSVYVALGDSYTSGPGIPYQSGEPAGCDRSTADYPALVAQALKISGSAAIDVSCSGARISDLTAAQSTKQGVNSAQMGALSAADTLVTVGIGGNDVDFAGVLTHCIETDLVSSLMDPTTTPCKAYYTVSGPNQLDEKIESTAASLSTALKRIAQRAPYARVYVVGYPDLLPSGGTSCSDSLGITSGDVAYLNQEELKLNSMLSAQAKAAGDTYVDTYTPSLGHDACSGSSTRWIEPVIPTTYAAPMHPNERGERGMADAVLAAIRQSS